MYRVNYRNPMVKTDRKPHRQIKSMKLPWWWKSSLVIVPMKACGYSGAAGTLSTGDFWIKSKPEETRSILSRYFMAPFRMENSKQKFGREYCPMIVVKTNAGFLRGHSSCSGTHDCRYLPSGRDLSGN